MLDLSAFVDFIYVQTEEGAAMRFSIIANLYMEVFEERATNRCHG